MKDDSTSAALVRRAASRWLKDAGERIATWRENYNLPENLGPRVAGAIATVAVGAATVAYQVYKEQEDDADPSTKSTSAALVPVSATPPAISEARHNEYSRMRVMKRRRTTTRITGDSIVTTTEEETLVDLTMEALDMLRKRE